MGYMCINFLACICSLYFVFVVTLLRQQFLKKPATKLRAWSLIFLQIWVPQVHFQQFKLVCLRTFFSFLVTLFCLHITEEQLDFPVLYASAKEGWASLKFTKCPPDSEKNMSPLLDSIVQHVRSPKADLEAPFQMLVSIPNNIRV